MIDVRFAFDGEREQLIEQPPELEIIFQHVRNADDRVLRQVKRQFHSGGGHLRAARAEELRRPAICFARSAETSSAASKSPLASPAMSMKVFGFTVYFNRRDAKTQRK